MNTFKKFAASLAALTTVAALGIGSFCVSADELSEVNMNLLSGTATEEEQFIASYEKADEKLAANYYLENDISLADAKEMMDIYQEGARQIAASKNSDEEVNFYSTTNLSSNQHYGIVIANNGSACTSVTLNLKYNPTWISFNSSLGEDVFDGTSNLNFTSILPLNLVTIGGAYIGNKATETPSGVADIPFNVTMIKGNQGKETYSEGTLYHKFTFTRESSTPIMGDSTFCYETYVNGDVNHDGIVDGTDINYLTKYNLKEITLDDILEDCNYTDKSQNIANIVNLRAMDANKDGAVSLADLIIIKDIQE